MISWLLVTGGILRRVIRRSRSPGLPVSEDRIGLPRKLDLCIDPLDPEKHNQPDHIVNISSGCISPETVNVHLALEMGQTLMQKSEDGWGPGFFETICKPVQTMSLTNKHVSVG